MGPLPGSHSGPTVSLAGVTKHYRGGGGIDEVTLEVWPGQVLGLLGPNGAGKTTTIRLLLDLIRPDTGRIELFGMDSRRDSVAIRRRIGYLPGDLVLYDRFSPRELLVHFAHLRGGIPWPEIGGLAEQFDLDLDRPIGALSKGNRQKVGLVQALMGRPDLLILDEPTSGLDPLVQKEVHAMIRGAASAGRTVLLSSHVLSAVGQVADRVGLIRRGRFVAVERVDDLRRRSVHFVDAVFTEKPDPELFAGIPGVVWQDGNAGPPRGDGLESVRVEVHGSLDPVVATLAKCRLADLSVREPDLEELFLAFYEGDHGQP